MHRTIIILLISICLCSCGSLSESEKALKTATESEQISVRLQENAREVNEVLHQINTDVDDVIKFVPGEKVEKVKGIKRGIETAIRLNSKVVKLADQGHEKAQKIKDHIIKIDDGSLDKWVKGFTQIGLILFGFGIMAFSYLCPGRGHTVAGVIISGSGIMLVSYWDYVAQMAFYALAAFAIYFIFIFIKHRNLNKVVEEDGQ